MEFSLKMEVISIIIIGVLLSYYNERQKGVNLKNRCFRFCLHLSLISIFLNILAVWGIRFSSEIPLFINMLLSSAYYLVTCFLGELVTAYLFYLIFEHTSCLPEKIIYYYRNYFWCRSTSCIFKLLESLAVLFSGQHLLPGTVKCNLLCRPNG